MPKSIHATNSEISRSFKDRHGNRYYPVDETYDKRVYENTVGNYIKIILVLIAFWLFQAIHWWFVFELGINWTEILMYYSIGIFAFTIIVGACMLTSGKFANKKKRLYEFLQEKISEKKAEKMELEMREKQEAEYKRKVKLAAEKEAAEAAAANTQVQPGNFTIQDDDDNNEKLIDPSA